MAPVHGQSSTNPKRSGKQRVTKHKKTIATDFHCGICLDSNTRKKTVRSPCPGQHQFHHSCLMRWCKNSSHSTCPMCRQDITPFYDSLRTNILKKWNSSTTNMRYKLTYLPMYSFPKRFEDDEEVLLPLCLKNPLLFQKVSSRLKDSFVFVQHLLVNSHLFSGESFLIFRECSLTIRNDKDIASQAIRDSWKSASYIGDELKKNKDFMLYTIIQNSFLKYGKLNSVYKSFHVDLTDDKQIILECLDYTSKIYSGLAEKMKKDSDVYNRALDRYVIEYDCQRNTDDSSHFNRYPIYEYLPNSVLLLESTIDRIIKSDPLAIRFLPHEPSNSVLKKEHYIQAILRNPYVKFLTPQHFDHEFYIVLSEKAVEQNGLVLEFIHDDQFITDEIALLACKQNGKALLYVRPSQRKKYEIVEAAIESCPESFYYCDLKSNPTIVEKAVMRSMKLLHRCSGKLKKDLTFLTMILDKYGTKENVEDFLSNVDPIILNNKTIIKKSVMLNGLVLQYSSEHLKKDDEICRLAYKQTTEAVRFMSNEILNKFIVMTPKS